MKQQILEVLFWSIIAAAFIGPGTVTTAAAAGAGYQWRLLWALLFSTIACVVLQEASARLTITTGLDLGSFLAHHYRSTVWGPGILFLTVMAILFGCAAYEVGNLLGSLEGLRLFGLTARTGWTLCISVLAGLLLWTGRTDFVARTLGAVVALMGLAFVVTAVGLHPPLKALVRGAVFPAIPPGAMTVVLGLVGTTVVPYNLFLGSGIAHGQVLNRMRFGLVVAIGLGGLISGAVLVTGSAVVSPFTFRGLAHALRVQLGPAGPFLLAFGLFAAGFTSAVTAPMAAAVTARGLFRKNGDPGWEGSGWKFRGVWLTVLGVGVIFAFMNLRPVPAIILAQAFNGLLLPLVTVILFVVVNDPRRVPREGLNRWWMNGLFTVVLWVVTILGIRLLIIAGSRLLKISIAGTMLIPVIVATGLTAGVGGWIVLQRHS